MESQWGSVHDLLDCLVETHGENCVNDHKGLIVLAYELLRTDSADSVEFNQRMSDYLIDLIGPTQ